MDQLDQMKSYRRVVELGGFGKAATDIGLSPAGISKQIRQLEERLQVVLLQRTTRRMSVTEIGQKYYVECCRILDEIAALDQTVHSHAGQISGRLRINIPLSFGLSTLSPLLIEFTKTYPDLVLDMTLTDRIADVIGEGFDVSIRAQATLEDSSLIAKRLADINQVICASPDYLDHHGMPETMSDLAKHDLLSYTLSDLPGVWEVEGPKGSVRFELSPRVFVNNGLLLCEMMVAGVGIGALPSFLAKKEIAKGRLVAILQDHLFPIRHVYALYPTTRFLHPNVRAFIDFLSTRLTQE